VRVILGVHIIGERASELVHIGQMATRYGGTIDVFIETVFNFPAPADACKYAAYDAPRQIQRSREYSPFAQTAPA
jgi:NAD(P) transhydrogenase